LQFYTIEDITKILRVSVPVVRQLIRDGKLKATKVGAQFRISDDDLREFVRQQQVQPPRGKE
jgi:excisionase family DNA binding protein